MIEYCSRNSFEIMNGMYFGHDECLNCTLCNLQCDQPTCNQKSITVSRNFGDVILKKWCRDIVHSGADVQ